MKNFIEKIGGRKMILSILIIITSSILVYFSKIDQDSYYTLVKYIVLIYLGGNVTQAAIVKKSSNKNVEFAQDLVDIVTQGQTLDQMGGRKFLFVIGIFIISIVLLLLKVIEAMIYVDICNWLAVVYIGSNVTGKALESGITLSVNKPDTKPSE